MRYLPGMGHCCKLAVYCSQGIYNPRLLKAGRVLLVGDFVIPVISNALLAQDGTLL
jgi:hypothetical protein